MQMRCTTPMQPIHLRLPDRLIDWIDQQRGDTASRGQLVRDLIDKALHEQQAATAPQASPDRRSA